VHGDDRLLAPSPRDNPVYQVEDKDSALADIPERDVDHMIVVCPDVDSLVIRSGILLLLLAY
jgi:hypothetical protein